MAKKIEVVGEFKKPSDPPKVKLSIEGSDIFVHDEHGEENILGRLNDDGTLTLFALLHPFDDILEVDKRRIIKVTSGL